MLVHNMDMGLSGGACSLRGGGEGGYSRIQGL